jgi:hypothetical protein
VNIPVTREQAIANAAATLIHDVAVQAARTPRDAAKAAWHPGHPLGTVDAIEAAIIQRRGEDAQLIAEMDAKSTQRVA